MATKLQLNGPVDRQPSVSVVIPTEQPAAWVEATAGSRPAPPEQPGVALTWDQFLAGQLLLLLATALVFGVIAYAASSRLAATRPAAGPAVGAPSVTTSFAPGTVAQQVPIATDPSGALRWEQSSYQARAGDVTFVVTNASPLVHDFAVTGPGVSVHSPALAARTTQNFTLKGLQPGTYQIACNIAGHKEAGMVATLVVK